MKRSLTLLLITFMLLFICKAQDTMIDRTVVKDLEIEKYLGKWYEIARYDNRFERNLVGVTATYSWRDDGMIKVVNSGYRNSLDGKLSIVTGKARIPDPDIQSKLEVSFFLFFYGDYYVLELDGNYQWAVVGSSSDKYLWVLSRTPKMDSEIFSDLINRLRNRGYDVSKLIMVEQRG